MNNNKLIYLIGIIVSILAISTYGLIQSDAAIGLQVFHPAEISTVLNNPYMGWAPWAYNGSDQQSGRLAFVNVPWSKLEPEKGKYDFNTFERENKFGYWQRKGVKIILRINMDYPGSQSHMDIPEWLYDEIGQDGAWYDNPYGKGFSPNYSNIVLLSYHQKLIQALAARYNKNGLIAFVEIGSVGHWGEFHTWQGQNSAIPFPGTAITDAYASHYVKAFKDKFLLMRRPFTIAKNHNMGLFNDSFGDINQTYNLFFDYINNGYIDYFTKDRQPEMPDFWKSAPSGGEFANYPGLQYIQEDTIGQTFKALADTHVSWLGPSFPSPRSLSKPLLDNLNKISNAMGYRFVVKSVSHTGKVTGGSKLPVEMAMENKGVAPFYYKWPLELSL